ncbi:regulatory factor X, 4 (influences HLA class II expression) [Bulinus truncatus]|nr:regulatory factor X, 4 (influences HLA class II expression) [Bulinus truncatus]
MESLEYNERYNFHSQDDGDMGASKMQTLRKCSKPHSTPLTLKWLDDNYVIAEGACLPRSTLYEHYLEFCRANDTNPVNAASFGKIIRQRFPLVTTRRLGTRGQSKYHYYGIGLKGSLNYINGHFQQTSPVLKDVTKEGLLKQANATKVKASVVLPEFPNVKDMKLPGQLSESKVLTFLMMYRAHCQRVLDTVVRSNFVQVSDLLLHFWQGMPTHVTSILHEDVVVRLVAVCDSLLYKAVSRAVMPSLTQPISDSLNQLIRNFSRDFVDWIKVALSGLPDSLLAMKLEVARNLSQLLRRQLSLNHLVQAARTVLTSQEVTGQLLHDWLSVDLNSIVKQTLYTLGHQYTDMEQKVITELCFQFEKLLDEQATTEAYIEWLENMIESCVLKVSARRRRSLKKISRQFLLMWSCFGTRVIRDMTLHSAPSFGSFHLIHLMFNDYVLYRIETIHYEEKTNQHLSVMKGETMDSDSSEDLALPDPVIARSTHRGQSFVNQVSLGSTPQANNDWTSCSDSDYDSRSECLSSCEDSVDQSHSLFEHVTIPVAQTQTILSPDQCVYRNDSPCMYPSQQQSHPQRRQYHHHHHHHHQQQQQLQEQYHQRQATGSRNFSQHPVVPPHQLAPHQCCYNSAQQALCSYNTRPENGLLDNNGQFEFHCLDQIHHVSTNVNIESHDRQTSHSYHSQPSLIDSSAANCMFPSRGNEHAHCKETSSRNEITGVHNFSDYFVHTASEFPSSSVLTSRRKCTKYCNTDSIDLAKSSKRFKSSNTSLYL